MRLGGTRGSPRAAELYPLAAQRRSLRTWIAQLPRERFLRVQQSYLVNGSRIQQLDRGPRWSLTLEGRPEPIPVGRAFRHSLRLHMAF